VRHQRRFAIGVIGLVLMCGGRSGTAFRQWTVEE